MGCSLREATSAEDEVLKPAGRLLERTVGAMRRRTVRQMNDGPRRLRLRRVSGSVRSGVNRTRLIGPPPLSKARVRPSRGPRLRSRVDRRSVRRRRWVFIAFVVVASAGGLGGLLRADRVFSDWTQPGPEVNMRELVSEGRLAEAGDVAARMLSKRPLNPEANLIRGVAALYGSISPSAVASFNEGNGERSEELLATAVVSLRRALLDTQIIESEPAAHYALGKAYYHRGYFYYDLAVRYLEASLKFGYDAVDTYEYLGLAYAGLVSSVSSMVFSSDASASISFLL